MLLKLRAIFLLLLSFNLSVHASRPKGSGPSSRPVYVGHVGSEGGASSAQKSGSGPKMRATISYGNGGQRSLANTKTSLPVKSTIPPQKLIELKARFEKLKESTPTRLAMSYLTGGQQKLFDSIFRQHKSAVAKSSYDDLKVSTNKLLAALPQKQHDYQLAQSLLDQTKQYIIENHSDAITHDGDIKIELLPENIQAELIERSVNKLEKEAELAAHERCLSYNQKVLARHEALIKKIVLYKQELNRAKQIYDRLARFGMIDQKLQDAIQRALSSDNFTLHEIQTVLSQEIKAVLDHCKVPNEKFETMVCNTFQQFLHDKNINVLIEQAALFKVSEGRERLRAYIDVTIKSAAFTMDVIKDGTPQEALVATQLTGVLHEATKLEAAIGKGLLTGAAVATANALITGAVIAACPEAGCLVIAQKIYDYVYFTQESAQSLNNQIQQTANTFQALPLDQRTENVAFFFSSLVTPILTRFTGSVRFVEMMASLSKAVKNEYAALRSYVTLSEQYTATYRGFKFPCVHEASLKSLIDAGKVTTQAHVDQYVQVVSGPITYLTSKCSESAVKTAQALQASTGSAAAFVSAEAKIAKDALPLAPQGAAPTPKLGEPKIAETPQLASLQAQYKSAGDVQVSKPAEGNVVVGQTPEGVTFAFQDHNPGSKPAAPGNPAPKTGGGQSVNPKAVAPVQKDVQWKYYKKHIPPKGVLWKEIVKQTKTGDAKYHPEVHIEALEKQAWTNGTIIKNEGHDIHKVFDCGKIIGAYKGVETQYVIIKCCAKEIHGHPILYDSIKK